MPENVMFQEAIEAVRQGQRSRARDLLTRLLRADQNNPEYWLWLSSVVDSLKEQIFCLQNVLRLDPGNPKAKRGLILLGAAAPGDDLIPAPVFRRKWEVSLPDEKEKPTGWRGFIANPLVRAGSIASLGVVVVVLISIGVLGFRNRSLALAPATSTRTFGPTSTFTLTPTYYITARSQVNTPTPRPTRQVTPTPTPLGILPDITLTPTSFYVITPHNLSEAYDYGLKAYISGDYQQALQWFKQSSALEPQAADLHYYLGETYRQIGDLKLALNAYEQAIAANPEFGPAYLGRALTRLAQNPNNKVAADLDMAIEKDPNFGLAYLERAAYFLSQGELDGAVEDLLVAQELIPDSPRISLYTAQISFSQEEFEQALKQAEMAINQDPSLLPAYLILGQAATALDNIDLAMDSLEIYVSYVEDDPGAWNSLGKAYYHEGVFHDAIASFDKALDLDSRIAEAYLYRGLANLEVDESKRAVNDLVSALRFDGKAFLPNISLGQALFEDGRLVDARKQITACEKLASTDAERAQVYYWRALVLEAAGYAPGAISDWEALLDLPRRSMPAEWREYAQESLAKLVTPTPEK